MSSEEPSSTPRTRFTVQKQKMSESIVIDLSDDDDDKQTNPPDVILTYPPHVTGAITLTRMDYACLSKKEYLNDRIIEFYLTYLVENVEASAKNHVYSFPTFFFEKLRALYRCESSVNEPSVNEPNVPEAKRIAQLREKFSPIKRWTKNVNIFEKRTIFIPINDPEYFDEEELNDVPHWYLAVICRLDVVRRLMTSKTEFIPCILIFDSLRSSRTSEQKAALYKIIWDYLTFEYYEKYEKVKIFGKDNCKANYPYVLEQHNDYDCGVYLLEYAECLLKKPIQRFTFPMQLETWFSTHKINEKRYDIHRLIKKLMLEQNPHVSKQELWKGLPVLKFSSNCLKARKPIDDADKIDRKTAIELIFEEEMRKIEIETQRKKLSRSMLSLKRDDQNVGSLKLYDKVQAIRLNLKRKLFGGSGGVKTTVKKLVDYDDSDSNDQKMEITEEKTNNTASTSHDNANINGNLDHLENSKKKTNYESETCTEKSEVQEPTDKCDVRKSTSSCSSSLNIGDDDLDVKDSESLVKDNLMKKIKKRRKRKRKQITMDETKKAKREDEAIVKAISKSNQTPNESRRDNFRLKSTKVDEVERWKKSTGDEKSQNQFLESTDGLGNEKSQEKSTKIDGERRKKSSVNEKCQKIGMGSTDKSGNERSLSQEKSMKIDKIDGERRKKSTGTEKCQKTDMGSTDRSGNEKKSSREKSTTVDEIDGERRKKSTGDEKSHNQSKESESVDPVSRKSRGRKKKRKS